MKLQLVNSFLFLSISVIVFSGCECALTKAECPSHRLVFDIKSDSLSLFFAANPIHDFSELALKPVQDDVVSPIVVADASLEHFRTEIFSSGAYRLLIDNVDHGNLIITIDRERIKCCHDGEGIFSLEFDGESICQDFFCAQFGVDLHI